MHGHSSSQSPSQELYSGGPGSPHKNAMRGFRRKQLKQRTEDLAQGLGASEWWGLDLNPSPCWVVFTHRPTAARPLSQHATNPSPSFQAHGMVIFLSQRVPV